MLSIEGNKEINLFGKPSQDSEHSSTDAGRNVKRQMSGKIGRGGEWEVENWCERSRIGKCHLLLSEALPVAGSR